MAIHVEIEEITYGFIVSLFDSNGPEELDKKVFVKTVEEAMKAVADWVKEEKEAE